MNMLTAIAESAGNKARAINDHGKIVIVLQRFEDRADYFWHCWLLIDKENTSQISTSSFETLKNTYHVDPHADYWQSV